MRFWASFGLGLLAAAWAPGAELVLLQTGYRIRAERHESNGDRVRIYTQNGAMELPASAILRFEPLDTPTPPAPAVAPEKAEASIDELIEEIGAEMGLHPALVRSIVTSESSYDPKAVSVKGAIGLMQLMPGTARELDVDPHDPAQNLRGGARYLRAMLDRYRGEPDSLVRALAAYNAGPGAVDNYDGLPPYSETRTYVRRVLSRFLALTEESSAP